MPPTATDVPSSGRRLPAAIADLPWLAAPYERFSSAADSGRLAHALLVQGPGGWGQELLAEAMVRDLLALAEDRSLVDFAHPDYRQLQPDGAMIKVDQIRSLREFAIGTRQQAPAKVGVLYSAHALNTQAANALLKTLEEPAPGNFLLLITEYPGRLLPTIRSRCQSIVVRPDGAAGARWLVAQISAEHNSDQALTDLAFEYGDAPLATLAAWEAGIRSLRPALEAGLARAMDAPVLEALLPGPLESVLVRLLRYLSASLARDPRGLNGLRNTAPRAIEAFIREVLFVQRGFLLSNSINHGLQLERLAYRFAQLPP